MNVERNRDDTSDPVPFDQPTDLRGESSASDAGCRKCGSRSDTPGSSHAPRPPSYVYALGQVDFRLPNMGVERELAQVISRTDTAHLTDRQAVSEVINRRENRYLARQLCYVFTVQGMDTYALVPRDAFDIELLAEAVRPDHRVTALDVVVGVRGPVPPSGRCSALALPEVAVDQLYSFDTGDLVAAIDKPDSMATEQFDTAAEDLLRTVMRVADNVGASDEHRALTYLLVRSSDVYTKTFEAFMNDSSLKSIEVLPSNIGGPRRVMNVVLAYSDRRTDVTEKFFVPVDVTDMYPFRLHGLSPYYDHH
ncbi:hypothetical protein ACFYM0_36755 [Streptomyces sp. NPDC006487]|uniref:cyanobactin maturation protease PatG family protein n=1 Tax=unclassified Streptomyces TaxID=2593676 RepID=UPI00366832D1